MTATAEETAYPLLPMPSGFLTGGPRNPRILTRQVRGDSMTGDDIEDGDLVIGDPGREPADGDICIVWVTNWRSPQTGRIASGRLVRHVRFTPDGLALESSSPAHPPMVLGFENYPVIMEAVVIGLVRSYAGGLRVCPLT